MGIAVCSFLQVTSTGKVTGKNGKTGGTMFDGKEYDMLFTKKKVFSKAAQKLYITQPALSTAIKKVEKKIGSPIFDRSTSPIGLTPSGEVYIDAIENFLHWNRIPLIN